MDIYVVVREVNDYDQWGGYFVTAFNHKPTKSELAEVLEDLTSDVLDELLLGYGRMPGAEEWYYLIKTSPGIRYIHDEDKDKGVTDDKESVQEISSGTFKVNL